MACSSRPEIITSAPSQARIEAIAAPMPLAPPVTSATLPVSGSSRYAGQLASCVLIGAPRSSDMARQSHANAPTAAVVTGRKSQGPRRILGAMKPAPFGYVRPESIDDALAHLAADPGAVPIAGGQTLLGQLNLRLRRPTCLVDLSAIEGLGAIAPLDGGVR